MVSYLYDYGGHLVQTVARGKRTYLAPTDNFATANGQSVAWISFGPLRLAAEVDGVLWFFHADILGNMDLMTDALGKAATRVVQTLYGVTRASDGPSPNPSALTLAVVLSGVDITGFVCQGLRWYDPEVGQFISPDPFLKRHLYDRRLEPLSLLPRQSLPCADPTNFSFWSILEIIGIASGAAACVVSQRRNGAWVVQQPPWNMDKDPPYGLWRVIEYDRNDRAKYSGLLQVWGLGLHDPD